MPDARNTPLRVFYLSAAPNPDIVNTWSQALGAENFTTIAELRQLEAFFMDCCIDYPRPIVFLLGLQRWRLTMQNIVAKYDQPFEPVYAPVGERPLANQVMHNELVGALVDPRRIWPLNREGHYLYGFEENKFKELESYVLSLNGRHPERKF